MSEPNGTPRQLQLKPYHVQNLFSEHYLAEVLPQTALWDLSGMEQVREQIQALWDEQDEYVEGHSEAALEEEFIRPVLEALGHVTYVQPPAGKQTPDYAFFADDGAKSDALDADRGGAEFWGRTIAVGDAKTWDRSLDRKLSATSGWDNQNPSFQIYHYLAETGCRWGILTNGRLWRIYPGQPKPSMDSYYEVDLLQALTAEDRTDFAYFLLFFRREAFIADEKGETFLDYVRDESDQFAAKLREDIRGHVYDALGLACEGFLSYAPNDLAEDDLKEIHDNALVLLYRLLFILYAESDELLPLDNSQYRDGYSLFSLKNETQDRVDTYTDEDRTIWPRLTNLFEIVNAGRDALDVPAYNGGLFKPDRHPFLEDHALPDSYIARIINLLAIDAEGRFADYRDLGVRHLGSIYEGLLEYRVEVADEPLRAVKDNGSEVWKAAEEDEAEISPGQVYLVTDKGERKATGSYYTPQYIVEYIVENTVGPLADECEQPEDILELNVLDPAMGSGHFLVEVTDFLARRAAEMEVEAEETLGDDSAVDVSPEQSGGETPGGHASDPTEESDVQRLKRQVVERCVYGVDLNPLAVELAKLSLWLHTVARGRPLSFLDHHLRCGNSLIGADLGDIASGVPVEKSAREKKQEAAGQLSLFDHSQWTLHAKDLVFGFTEIEQGLSESTDDIEQKERILENLDDVHRKPYLEMADTWCSRYFGNDFDNDTYGEIVGYLQEVNPELSDETRQVYDRAQQIAAERRFFHWEFEFPEVFFTATGTKKPNPGFDAVVGNPPYLGVRTGSIDDDFKDYASNHLPLARGQWDLFAVMTDRAMNLIRENGWWSFIMPRRALQNEQYEELRNLLFVDNRTHGILDAGTVFSDANVEACVIYTQRSRSKATKLLRVERLQGMTPIQVGQLSLSAILQLPFVIIPINHSPREAAVGAKLSAGHRPFSDFASITRGAECGINDPSITHDPEGRGVKLVRGDDVKRYHVTWSGWRMEPDLEDTSKYKTSETYERTPKLLIRFVAPGLTVALDNVGYWNTNVVYNVHTASLSSPWILTLLNSRLLDWWFRLAFQGDEALFPHVQKSHLARIPIRIIDFEHPTAEGEMERLMERCREAIGGGEYDVPLRLAKQALAAHAALHGPAGKPELAEDDYWKAQIEAADRDFPGREDFVHDLLAELAQRMMDLNETKHETIERFEADLRGVAAADLHEDLTRGKQGRTLHRSECCRPYVEEGSYTTHSLHETLGWSQDAFEIFVKELCGSVKTMADMNEIYDRHADSFRQTTTALASTDTLIDKIVYALYGLRPEEIAIVEEGVGERG